MGALAAIVGANIRRLRQARKLSLEALSARGALDVKYLGQIERGKANCTLAVIEKIAGALGVEPLEVLRPGPAAAGRPPDLESLMARLDETVSSVREAIVPYMASPISRGRRPRGQARR